MLNCTATFPTLPDPANTPATKQPVSQHFSVSVNGAEAVAETEYALDVTQAAPFEVAEGASISLAMRYKDSSGLFSAYHRQDVTAPQAEDTTPPDAPGEFGEIRFDEIPPLSP